MGLFYSDDGRFRGPVAWWAGLRSTFAFAAAMQHSSDGEHEQAVVHARKAVALSKAAIHDPSQMQGLLVRSLMRTGKNAMEAVRDAAGADASPDELWRIISWCRWYANASKTPAVALEMTEQWLKDPALAQRTPAEQANEWLLLSAMKSETDLPAAQEALARAIELAPPEEWATEELICAGELRCDQHPESEEGVRWLQIAVERNHPELDEFARSVTARALAKAGRHVAAAEVLSSVPNRAEQAAFYYLKAEDPQAALDALAGRPLTQTTAWRRARAHLALNQFEESLRAIDAAESAPAYSHEASETWHNWMGRQVYELDKAPAAKAQRMEWLYAHGRSKAYEGLGQPERALEFAKLALDEARKELLRGGTADVDDLAKRVDELSA